MIIVLLICLILCTFDINSFMVSIVFFSLSTLIMFFYIILKKDYKSIKIILLLSLILRIVFMLIDLYYIRLPHAGADDDYFFETAIFISNDYSLLFTNMYGGIYPKILSLLFLIIGNNRLGVQFINVILSIIFLSIMNDNLKLLKLKYKTRILLVFLLAFLPNGLFLGCILRREAIISLLLAISCKYIIKWFDKKNIKYAIISFLISFIASLFHSAVLVVPVIILIYAFLYDFSRNKISFNGINFIKSVILIAIVGLFIFVFINNFQNKFAQFENINDVYSEVTNTRGNSIYLANLEINNFFQLLIYTPLKTIYFIFSPMLWNVRGLSDIITIFFDSFIYLILIFKIIKYKPKNVSKIFITIFTIFCVIFALGTFTSGTAVRHRYNALPFLILSYASIFYKRDENKT